MSGKSLRSLEISTDGEKTVVFTISRTFSLPKEIQDLTVPEFEGYMTLIAGIHTEIRNKSYSITDSEKEETQKARTAAAVAKQVLAVRQETAETAAAWQEERSRLSAQIQRLQLQLEKYEIQLTSEKDTIQTAIEMKYRQVVDELRSTNVRVAEDCANKISAAKAANEEVVSFYKEQVSTLKERTACLEEKLIERTAVSKSSVRRGRQAEEEFAEQASAACGWTCERKADTAHNCDYSAVISGLNVLFELKNYTNVVPAKEVQKFRRDIEEHREVHVGVFITTQTEISGMRNGGPLFRTEWTANRQLLIFITHFNDDIAANFDMLDKILGVAAISLLEQDIHNNDTIAQIRLERGLKYLETAQERLRTIINRTLIDKRVADDNYTQSLTSLKMLREEMLIVFRELSGEVVEEIYTASAVPSTPLIESPPIKKKAKKMKSTETITISDTPTTN